MQFSNVQPRHQLVFNHSLVFFCFFIALLTSSSLRSLLFTFKDRLCNDRIYTRVNSVSDNIIRSANNTMKIYQACMSSTYLYDKESPLGQ